MRKEELSQSLKNIAMKAWEGEEYSEKRQKEQPRMKDKTINHGNIGEQFPR